MRLQPYREKDAENIVKWIEDEKSHAKWEDYVMEIEKG